MHFALPFNLKTANFFVSAYQGLAMMVIDGVARQISYTDIYTSNVATQADPTQHELGADVHVVFVDTESVGLEVLPRNEFNSYLNSMTIDLELRCSLAGERSSFEQKRFPPAQTNRSSTSIGNAMPWSGTIARPFEA
jgi:hypothetical protein